MSTILASAIVVILLLLFSGWSNYYCEQYLYGFWVADEDFCEDSEIDSMLFFIGERERGFLYDSRTCYLVITDDMCNQGMTMTYLKGWKSFGLSYKISAKVEFDEEQLWDEYVDIEINMNNGTMKISSNGVVYARLTKQHDTTNMCAEND